LFYSKTNFKSLPMNTHLIRLAFLLIFCAITNTLTAQSTDIPGPSGSERFGTSVTILANGNYVVADPYYDEGAISNVGAVYLYNGSTHTIISTLKGSTADNQVGLSGIIALPNSSYLVQSWAWDNGATLNVGAITWVNGTTGINGVVSSSNSLIGSQNGDLSGARIEILTNGNYVISTPYWSNGAVTQAGAVTWGSGTTGRTGVVGPSISLVGTQVAESLGFGSVAVLTNGNYVVGDPLWNGGFGAAVWCNGTTGRTGTISAGIALVGSNVNHSVGGVTALSNGNYAVYSPNWDNGAIANVGAITWGNGTTGTTGTVSTANSFIGSKADDQVGSSGIIALNNGNYIIVSPYCDNGAIIDAGAVTWRNGTGSTSGTVSSSNSLVGGSANDNIGSAGPIGVTALNNGNYVVSSPLWDNGTTTDAGAVTWGNGTTGTSGIVSSSNSLVGTSNNDNIGSGSACALSNGNYVIASENWDNGPIGDAGAATWGNGTTGTTGAISSANSLVGNNTGDNVASGGIIALTNGNYVVPSPFWDNGATANVGAVTWCDGTIATATSVATSNSFIGSTSVKSS
jgi:hypothetical protein